MAPDRGIELLRKGYSDGIESVINDQTNAIVLDGVHRAPGIASATRGLDGRPLGDTRRPGRRRGRDRHVSRAYQRGAGADDPVTSDLADSVLAEEEAHRPAFRGSQ